MGVDIQPRLMDECDAGHLFYKQSLPT